MRRFLYSKWFFGFLALVCLADMAGDFGVEYWGWKALNPVHLSLDIAAVGMSLWMFIDLHVRAPKHGRDPRR
jgi:hypothetical protein